MYNSEKIYRARCEAWRGTYEVFIYFYNLNVDILHLICSSIYVTVEVFISVL